MICLDSVRPDHLGCYGYSRNTSPNIDRLSGRGLRFSQALANATWTLPSIVTLFSSTYPSAHGLDTYSKEKYLAHPPPADAPVLPRFLAEKGWRTAGFSHGGWTAKAFGFDRWFDHWEEGPLFEIDQMVPRCLSWIDSARDRPFFIYIHTLSPHFPYRPQPPYRTKFGIDEEYYIPAEQNWLSLLDQALEGKINDRRITQMIRQYDGGIAFTDEAIGRLEAGLQERGLDKSTLIVLFADHGTQFLEHGLIFAGANAYEETARIPLIMTGPGIVPGSVYDRQFELIDFLPTLFDYLSLPLPPGKFQGVSVFSRRKGDRTWALIEDNLSKVEAIRSPRWMFMRDRASGRVELYDLEKDPGETTNLAPERKDLAKKFAAVLEKRHRENLAVGSFAPQTSPGRVWPENLKKELKAFGYDL